MAIRALTTDDHGDWRSLWEAYLVFYQTSLSNDVKQTTWQRLLDPAEPMQGWLFINDQGTAIGLAHTIRHRSCWTVGDYVYLQDLFTHPDHRGQGVAQALVSHCVEHARRTGADRLHWLTHESNHTAQRVYDRLADRTGFVQYRIRTS